MIAEPTGTDGLRAFGRSPRNPRTINYRSPLAGVLLSFSLQSPAGLEHATTPESDVQGTLIFPQRKQRHPGPDKPHRGIPSEHWPAILHRIEQGDTLRQIATEYGVSYETIRRTVKIARKREGK